MNQKIRFSFIFFTYKFAGTHAREWAHLHEDAYLLQFIQGLAYHRSEMYGVSVRFSPF